MGRLEDKVAVITGGSGGIGRAAATRFVAEGAKVMLVDIDENALKEAVEELGSNVASYCVADVSLTSDTQKYVEAAIEKYGGVDVYLANAGIEGVVSPIVDYDEEMFDKVMAVNTKGPIRLTEIPQAGIRRLILLEACLCIQSFSQEKCL